MKSETGMEPNMEEMGGEGSEKKGELEKKGWEESKRKKREESGE